MGGDLKQEGQGPVAGVGGFDPGRWEESPRQRAGNEKGRQERGVLALQGDLGPDLM